MIDNAPSLSSEALLNTLRSASLLVGELPQLPRSVHGVADDSRLVVRGGVFVAVRGNAADGHAYIDSAIARGASVVVVEDDVQRAVATLRVSDSRRAAAAIAAAFYSQPAAHLMLVGVTGTNGKTTTVHLVRALLSETGLEAASIGTLGVLLGRDGLPLDGGQGLTTPGPVEMQRLLRELVDRGVRAVAIEVSSHALDQSRVDGIAFDAVVFTSFSHDHLDYHHTMDAYFAAKAKLIGALKSDGVAVLNALEPAWRSLPRAPRVLNFSVDSRESNAGASEEPRDDAGAYVHADNVRYDASGSRFVLHASRKAGDDSDKQLSARAAIPLIGDFNVTNAAGAVAAAWALGQPFEALASALSTLPQAPGRLERLHTSPTVLRDYAHTPDALDRALRAVRPFARNPDGAPTRVFVVFGCGGDRDRSKRPVMGGIADRLADVVIITSDNPRTENPERILDDIEAGMTRNVRALPNARIEDRRSAIAHAINSAGPFDVILLAGKGHETYQIRGTERLHFDEAEVVAELVAERIGIGEEQT